MTTKMKYDDLYDLGEAIIQMVSPINQNDERRPSDFELDTDPLEFIEDNAIYLNDNLMKIEYNSYQILFNPKTFEIIKLPMNTKELIANHGIKKPQLLTEAQQSTLLMCLTDDCGGDYVEPINTILELNQSNITNAVFDILNKLQDQIHNL